MRIMIKGGVWKNTEDEILKAAVMKYGKNQWARISSLLVRKSAKQCKARWYEWLDPSIKKTEWSREEEEKLLHLAKLMPCQWRSIAPIVGRTASQCLEHYNKLLDAAQEKDESYDPADDPRRLRPGEIDPNPEAKPARPDPVDMDEDEKEMLSEARARLANTKGKKAKRKAREKQLEEARRLAALQKRRELKAAGIDLPERRRRLRGIDYNKEIPFQKKPAPGFYEIPPEELRASDDPSFVNVGLDKLEGKRRADEEARAQRMDAKKQRIKETKNLPAAVMQINKLNDPEQVRKRSKLILPEPQITDRELEEIAKMEDGGAIDNAGTTATKALLASYSATPARTPAPMRTPSAMRTPARVDTVLMEAQNLIALTTAQTPLKGGENTPLHPSDFSGATPRPHDIQTPNVLATPLRTPGGGPGNPAATPRRMIRDQLNINEEGAMSQDLSIHDEKRRQAELKKQVQMGLLKLPAPKNEYVISMPQVPNLDEESEMKIEEDASDLLEKERQKEKERLQEKMKQRSTVLKRNLPRPMAIPKYKPPTLDTSLPLEQQAEELLRAEVEAVLLHDNELVPVNPTMAVNAHFAHWDDFTEEELANARSLLDGETENNNPNLDEFLESWSEAYNDIIYVPQLKKYMRSSRAAKPQKASAIQARFDNLLNHMKKEAQRAAKLEKKLNVYFGGYMIRADTLLKQIADTHAQLDQAYTELECFKALQAKERAAIPLRIEKLSQEVNEQAQRENRMQLKYANLVVERDNVQQQLLSLGPARFVPS
jgi:pre-mRNA-splicing factor CDC5/CEF1